MDLKKTSTAYARMARLAVPKLFWTWPKSAFGEHLATKLVYSRIILFSQVSTLQADTDKQWQVATLKIYNEGLDRLRATLFW